MSQHARWTGLRRLVPALAAVYAVAACGGAGDATGPGNGGGNGNGNTGGGTHDLYVSATTGNDLGAGTQQRPFRTIAAALAAADSGTVLLLAGGTYVEAVVLESNVSLMGGYDPDSWKRDTAAFPTTIGDSGMTIKAAQVSHVVLDGLHLGNLLSRQYPVVLVDSSTDITIRGTTISALEGRHGYDGWSSPDYPDTAVAGDRGTAGATCPPDVTGGAGGYSQGYGGSAGGHGGKGGLAGGYAGAPGGGTGGGGAGAGGAAFATGSAGKTPTSVGAAGANGASGASFGSFKPNIGYSTASGGDGEEGAAGVGGGGGGGGGGNAFLIQCGGGGGGGGQGGPGGYRGFGGGGGAASIAVAVTRGSQLDVDHSLIITAGGGDAGAGGSAQPGGVGGQGGAGGAASVGTGAGGKGGNGGRGGAGGVGGGGGGGPSIGVLVMGNSTFTPTAVVYQIGPRGAGGISPAPASTGARGDSASVKTIQP